MRMRLSGFYTLLLNDSATFESLESGWMKSWHSYSSNHCLTNNLEIYLMNSMY